MPGKKEHYFPTEPGKTAKRRSTPHGEHGWVLAGGRNTPDLSADKLKWYTGDFTCYSRKPLLSCRPSRLFQDTRSWNIRSGGGVPRVLGKATERCSRMRRTTDFVNHVIRGVYLLFDNSGEFTVEDLRIQTKRKHRDRKKTQGPKKFVLKFNVI